MSYCGLGMEQLLSSVDHLLFLLGLLLLADGWRCLIRTLIAFTVAQSLTLSAASLGWVHVPQAPVDAAIALSIVFVAVEIVHRRQGRPGLTARKPWIVAFPFGLLHGLGFADAMSEVGIPETAIPLDLMVFNLGVEAGQIAVVLVVLVALRVSRSLGIPWPRWCKAVPVYALGTLAMYWTIDRTMLMIAG